MKRKSGRNSIKQIKAQKRDPESKARRESNKCLEGIDELDMMQAFDQGVPSGFGGPFPSPLEPHFINHWVLIPTDEDTGRFVG